MDDADFLPRMPSWLIVSREGSLLSRLLRDGLEANAELLTPGVCYLISSARASRSKSGLAPTIFMTGSGNLLTSVGRMRILCL